MGRWRASPRSSAGHRRSRLRSRSRCGRAAGLRLREAARRQLVRFGVIKRDQTRVFVELVGEAGFGQGVPTPGNPTIHRRYFGNGREGGPPHAARQITLPTALRDLLIYMCCDVCALLLGGFRHHTPAGGIRHFRDASVSHPDAFGACKLLGPASLYHHSPSARFRRPAASDLASDPYVWLPAG